MLDVSIEIRQEFLRSGLTTSRSDQRGLSFDTVHIAEANSSTDAAPNAAERTPLARGIIRILKFESLRSPFCHGRPSLLRHAGTEAQIIQETIPFRGKLGQDLVKVKIAKQGREAAALTRGQARPDGDTATIAVRQIGLVRRVDGYSAPTQLVPRVGARGASRCARIGRVGVFPGRIASLTLATFFDRIVDLRGSLGAIEVLDDGRKDFCSVGKRIDAGNPEVICQRR